jgi:hypothetical protein
MLGMRTSHYVTLLSRGFAFCRRSRCAIDAVTRESLITRVNEHGPLVKEHFSADAR